ncbi:FtsX-like permease family protein [Cellulosimicrobium sp. Marseille-Q4280]|uniref:FtsX-like permease family protein n=1 Tax=Cellulosimicrobium sp. Marseille-Q4280 TaxID=2937992 RepID=UPI00203F8BFB|nr:FtsX-like permease family protein [Cellulosimicrobium sp. Marseille-Q4280]
MRLARLTWRQFAAHRAVSVALAVVVLLVAFVVTAWPRAVAATNTAQVEHVLSTSTPLQRDVITVSQSRPDLGPAEPRGSTGLDAETEEVWGAFAQGLTTLRDAQPEPLRTALGDPAFTIEDEARDLPQIAGNDVRFPSGALKIDPRLADHVTLVAGEWPGPVEAPAPAGPQDGTAAVDAEGSVSVLGPQVLDVVASAEAADVLGWSVGDVHELDALTSVRLTGTFEAVDPTDDYWQNNPYSAAPQVVDDLNMGRSAKTALYLDAATADEAFLLDPTTRVWYPVTGAGVESDEVAPLLAQLRGFTATPHPVVEGGTFVLTPSSEMTTVLSSLLAQQRASAAILAVVVVGPLGVTLAVLLLGARLVVSRRRTSLALLRARGASGGQLRGLMGAEGLALGLPAAAIGAAAAVLAVPAADGGGAVGPSTFVAALLAALAPALLFALTTSPAGLRDTRADLGTTRSRWRGLVEVLVVAAAAVSVVLLLQRGVTVGAAADPSGSSAGAAAGAVPAAAPGIDPLLAAAPLLLALATCVLVLRVYPLPVRALERVLRSRRDLVPFLGAARAVRDPAGGVVPALALVVGVAVALFSGVLYSTVRSGVETLAWDTVGADVRVSGPIMDDEVVDELRAVDGVAAVATVTDAGELPLRVGVSGERVTVLAVDADELAAVQADVPGAYGLPEGLGASGDLLPVVVSDTLSIRAGARDVTLVASTPAEVDVLAASGPVPGLSAPRAFVVVDRDRAAEALDVTFRPRVALLALDDGADVAAVRAAVADVLPQSAITSPHEISADALGSPAAQGMNRAFVVAIVLSGLLCAAAVVMTLMIGAPARDRLVAVLRTLGLERRGTRGLVAWEIGPWALAALVVGALLGLAVPALVLAAVDLTPFTGGDAQPSLAVDPALLGLVAGGFVVVVVVAVAASTALSRRTNLAAELRIGEER